MDPIGHPTRAIGRKSGKALSEHLTVQNGLLTQARLQGGQNPSTWAHVAVVLDVLVYPGWRLKSKKAKSLPFPVGEK